jgi:hypothetical protein
MAATATALQVQVDRACSCFKRTSLSIEKRNIFLLKKMLVITPSKKILDIVAHFYSSTKAGLLISKTVIYYLFSLYFLKKNSTSSVGVSVKPIAIRQPCSVYHGTTSVWTLYW